MAHTPLHKGEGGPGIIPPRPVKTKQIEPKPESSSFLDRILDFASSVSSPERPPGAVDAPPGGKYPPLSMGADRYTELFRRGGTDPGFVDPQFGKDAVSNYAPAFQDLLDRHPIVMDPGYWGAGYTNLVTAVDNDDQSLGSPVFMGADPGSPEFNNIMRHELSHIAMIEILGEGSVSKMNEQVEAFREALWEVAGTIPEEMRGQIFDPDQNLGNFRTEDDFLQWLQMWGVEGGKPIGLSDDPHIDDRTGELFSEVMRWSGGDMSVIPKKLHPFFKNILDPNFRLPPQFRSGTLSTALISGNTREQPPFQGIKIFEEAEGTVDEVPANFDMTAFNKFVGQFPDIAERPAFEDEIIFAGRLIPRDEFTPEGLRIAEEFIRQYEDQIKASKQLEAFQERIRGMFDQLNKIRSGEFEVTGEKP